MADILRSIAARHGEGVIRAKWRDWVEKFTRVAAAFEERYTVQVLYILEAKKLVVAPLVPLGMDMSE